MSAVWITFLALLAILGVWGFLVAPGASKPAARTPFAGRNYAHRGLYEQDQSVPENSLPAFAAARAAGYGVELDLRLSKNGDVVVFHDDDLLRVCGVDARVDALTTGELLALRLCGTAERIPLFTEALGMLGPETPVIVELTTGPRNDLLCQKTLEILRAVPGVYCVESFDPRIVRWFRRHAPDLLRGQLAMPARFYTARSTGFLLSNLLMNFLSRPQFIAREVTLRSASLWLCLLMRPMRVVWTVRPEHDSARLRRENDAVIFEHERPAPRFGG